MRDFIIIFLFSLIFINCNQTQSTVLISEDLNRLKNDTILKGENLLFYPNGNIQKWIWYDGDSSNVPVFIMYFDSLGNYLSRKGNPFIGAYTTKKMNIAVEIVNPPINNIFIEYRDYLDEKLIEKIIYEPVKTDSTAWATLETHKYDSQHKYYIYFVLWSSNKFLIRDSIELVP